MKYEQLEDILRKSKQLAIPAVEKNIFSIGGRGHYENPISDIFAFFLDIHEVHGFGDLVLKSVNETAGLPANDTDLIGPPLREMHTDDDKRIDILIEGQDYVTIIENKIRHWAANPFDHYDEYLDKYYKNKTQYRFLLTVRKETPPNKNWVSLTYKDLLIRIRENFGEYALKTPYSKWLVLFSEFLLNIEQECEPDPMDKDRFEFIGKNYEAIQNLKTMADEYINELHNKALDSIRLPTETDDSNVFGGKESWGKDGLALRLYRKQWVAKTNITLLIIPTGSFRVQFYVYDIPDSGVTELRNALGNNKYKEFWTEKSTIRCFGFFEGSDLDVIFKEIQDVANKINVYYGNSLIS
jgi:hypothetical protein